MLISAIDSYFSYVAQQMATLNAQVFVNGATIAQPMGGVVDARDWPQTPVVEGALYLLLQRVQPIGGTEAQIEYEYFCQWSWLLIGTDIQAKQQTQSRADRYRANFQVMENLRQSNYPSFCRKQDYSADSQGNIQSVFSNSEYPVSATEMVRWTRLDFMPRSDNAHSGVTYGAARVSLYAYDDVSVLVA